jgi:RNA polymerase sigma-70 factor (ECF subfamily)
MKERVEHLVQRAQHGDVGAFGKLVKLFQDAVFGAAWTTAQDFQDAQDISQEAFILAYEHLPQLREPEKFPGWLRRITMTTCSQFLRSRKAVHESLFTVMDIPTNMPGPDAVAEAHQMKEIVLGEIGALSEKNRVVTTLYFIDEYSYRDISDFLEMPISTVKGRLHRSRVILQGRLIEMAKDVLHESKPGTEFVHQLRGKLKG